jgi:hypothetical protein
LTILLLQVAAVVLEVMEVLLAVALAEQADLEQEQDCQ